MTLLISVAAVSENRLMGFFLPLIAAAPEKQTIRVVGGTELG